MKHQLPDHQQITKEEAIQAQDAYISYCAGKKLAEQAIWDYVQREHPSYSVNVILPPLIFGAPIQDVKTLKNMNFSTDLFYSLINGTNEVVPPTPVAAYVSCPFDLRGRYTTSG